MARRCIWLGSLVAGCLAAGVVGCDSPGESQLEAGRRALGGGQYREAVALFAEATLAAPGTATAAEALHDMGVVQYLRLRDLESARATFRRVLAEYPESAVARDSRRLLARMYERDLASPEKAVHEYQKLLDAAGEPAEAKAIRLSLAGCLYALDDLGSAAEHYRHVIGQFPHDEQTDRAFLRLAHIEGLTGRGEEALAVLEALLAASDEPGSRYEAHLAEIELLLGLRQYTRAKASVARADREFPEDRGFADLAVRLGRQERDGRSLDDGAAESREILQLLQSSIPWGRGRRGGRPIH